MSGITAGALVGATCLESGGSNSASGKKRRSVRGSTYSIIVDKFHREDFHHRGEARIKPKGRR